MRVVSDQIKQNGADEPTGWPFFRLGFRPLFWLGSLYGIVNIGLWGLTFSNLVSFSPLGGSYFWHVHEMLFGFTMAIIVGFLLTAVQTWTGVPSVKGKPLVLLVLFWMCARILFFFPFPSAVYFALTFDLLFLILAAVFLSIPILKADMRRNLFFVPILLFAAFLNVLMYLSLLGRVKLSFLTIGHAMVLLVTLVMCIMGGRVFPMFTANGTNTPRVPPLKWLEKLSILSVLACVIVSWEGLSIPGAVQSLFFFVAGLSNFFRALRWRIWVTFKTPLVWSLHISYWAVCAGLILLGFAKLDDSISLTLAFHALTVGGIGQMVLSMISRVSLGHTGRIILVGKSMAFAFVAMVLASILRVLVPLFSTHYQMVILISATLWVVSYGLFVILYFPILFQRRVDGRDG